MGHKVNPTGIRVGIIRGWNSKWYAAKKNYARLIHQDIAIEKTVEKELFDMGVSHIEILRTAAQATINIHTAKPGLIIGRGGSAIEKLKSKLNKQFNDKFEINIKEVKKPMLCAKLMGESIARQIEKRISYRRAAKMAIDKIMDGNAVGAKIFVAGRLNGVEIARSEFFSKGKIPLHTFRADIDYAYTPALTTYGIISVKTWIYKGDIFKKPKTVEVVIAEPKNTPEEIEEKQAVEGKTKKQ